MKKIRAIFFDLGGVVLTQKAQARLETIAEVFEVNKKDLETVFKKYNNEWSTGKISVKILASKFKTEFKYKKSVPEILNIWKEVYKRRTSPNRELINLIDKLRQTYQIYLLTNTVDLHHNINSGRDIFGHFDGIFASFVIGKRKPETDYYLHVLNELKLESSECVFIDDLKENVEAAKNVGMEAILFKNNQKFIEDLNKLRIKI